MVLPRIFIINTLFSANDKIVHPATVEAAIFCGRELRPASDKVTRTLSVSHINVR